LEVTYTNNDQDVLHEIDGIDMWDVIKGDSTNSNLLTREILLDIDPYSCGVEVCGAIRYGKYKFIRSDTTLQASSSVTETCFWGRSYALTTDNDVLGCGIAPKTYLDLGYASEYEVDTNDVDVITCMTSNCAKTGCLYDLIQDPCEYYDISTEYPEIVEFLSTRLYSYNLSQAEPLQRQVLAVPDSLFNPSNYDDYWTPFMTSDKITFETILKEDVKTKKSEYEKWLKLQKKTYNPILSSSNNNNNLSVDNVGKMYTISGIIFIVLIYGATKLFQYITRNTKLTMSTTIDEQQRLIVK